MTAFILACIVIELTPGPNMAYLTIQSLTYGRRSGFATVAGIALGLACVATAAAFGMAELIQEHPLMYEIIRWAGIAYLLWLAVSSWREGEEISPAKTDGPVSDTKYFRRGFVVNVLNPKAAVFYLAVLPGFIRPSMQAVPQAFALIAISISIATIAHLLIVVFASSLRPLIDSADRQRSVRRLFAVLLAGVAVWFAFST